MLNSSLIRKLTLLLLLQAVCGALVTSGAQSSDPLRRLRDELASTNGLRAADIVIVMDERAVNGAAQRMVGLEVKHPSGATLRIKSARIELKPAQALITMEVTATPGLAVTSLNLHLAGSMGNAVVTDSSVRLPFELTEVTPAESKGSGFLTRLFSEWLTPKKWNESLPALELPIQMSQRLDLPGADFDAGGEVPMHLTMHGYQVNLDLTLLTLLVLDGRAVIALNIKDLGKQEPVTHATEDLNGADPAVEVARLSQHLITTGGVHMRFRKEAVNYLLSRIASYTDSDLTMDLKPGRIRSVEYGTPLGTIVNFTDVESGSGKANVDQIAIERMSETGAVIRIKGTGNLNARLAGREMGIPYRLYPDVEFAIKDELVPFIISSEKGHLQLRPASDAVVPIELRFPIELAGKRLHYSRKLELNAGRWLKSIDLPELFSREIELPRRIAITKDHHISIVRSEPSRYDLSNLKVIATSEALEIDAEIK